MNQLRRQPPLLLLAGAVFTFGSNAAGQDFYSGWCSDLQLTSNVSGSIVSLQAGRLNADARMDALIRTEDSLVLAFGPGMFESFLPFGSDSTSCTVLPGSAHDSVLACDAAGLKLWTWGQPSSGPATMQSVTLSNAGWGDAAQLQVIPEGSGYGVAAVTVSGDEILRGWWSGTAWTDLTPIYFEGGVRQLAVIDLDRNQPGLDYAVVSEYGFIIVDGNGASLDGVSLGAPGAGEKLVRIPEANGDRVAYFFPHAGYSAMTVVSETGFEPPLFLADTYGDFALADYDLDGRQDLLIGSATSPYTWILSRVDALNTFDIDLEKCWYIPHDPVNEYGLVAGNGRILPLHAVADFDFDGDLDVLAATPEAGWDFPLSLFRGDAVNERDLLPSVIPCLSEPEYHCQVQYELEPGTGAEVAALFDFEVNCGESLSEAQPPTHLEVLCYLQRGFTQFHGEPPVNYVAPTPEIPEYFELIGTSSSVTAAFSVPVAGQGPVQELVYHFALSPVRMQNGLVTRRWPTAIGLYADDVLTHASIGASVSTESIPLAVSGTWDGLSGGINERPSIRPTPPPPPQPTGGS